MPISKEIRFQLGLTQHQFAPLLGLEEGHLSMVDCGKRLLPTAAALRLARLHQLILQLPQPLPQPVLEPMAKAKLEKQLRKMEGKLQLLERKQEEWEAKTEGLQKILALAALPQLQDLFAVDDLHADQWNLVVRKARQQLSRYQFELIQLKISILGLSAGIEEAGRRIL